MDNPATLVALLEQKYDTVKDSTTQDLHATLVAGLLWETSYWVDCALNWIEDGAEVDERIAELLLDVSSKKYHPQATRHKAFKLSRKWLNAEKK